MNVIYTDKLGEIKSDQLSGFFEGLPQHPDPDHHLDILRGSYKVWLAMDGSRCVGFINALSDGILSAFIPLLEVLPEYRGKGIGFELMRRMIVSLDGMYAIDIVCDDNVAKFYEAHGFIRFVGMAKRNYEKQNGVH